jgi:hypothetical protein
MQLLDWSLGAALAVILIASSLALLYAASRLGASGSRCNGGALAVGRMAGECRSVGAAARRRRVRLSLFAGSDPDHAAVSFNEDQPVVLPTARVLAALVGAGVRARVDRSAALQPEARVAHRRSSARCSRCRSPFALFRYRFRAAKRSSR